MYHDLGYAAGKRQLADRVVAERLRRGCASGEICKLGTYADLYAKAASKFFEITGRGLATPEEEQEFFETPVVRNRIPEKNLYDTVHVEIVPKQESVQEIKVLSMPPKPQAARNASRLRSRSQTPTRMRGLSIPPRRRSASVGRRSRTPSRRQPGQRQVRRGRSKGRRNMSGFGEYSSPTSMPLSVYPAVNARSGGNVNNRSVEVMNLKTQDRFLDYTVTSSTLSSGQILQNILFQPASLLQCIRLSSFAKLYANYFVQSLVMEVIIKGPPSSVGGWVAYWDPDVNDDPSLNGGSSLTLLQLASSHTGVVEHGWQATLRKTGYMVRAPPCRRELFLNPDSAELYNTTSHRFVMLATSSSSLPNPSNLFTLILHARVRFYNPTAEPLNITPTSGTQCGAIFGTTLNTANNPFPSTSTTQTGSQLVLVNSPTQNVPINPGFIGLYNGSPGSYISLPAGTWFMVFNFTGTGITAVSLTLTNQTSGGTTYSTTLGNIGATYGVSATSAIGFLSVIFANSANTTGGISGASCSATLTATTVTNAWVRAFPIPSNLSLPRSKLPPLERLIHAILDKRLREESQIVVPSSQAVVEVEDDSKSSDSTVKVPSAEDDEDRFLRQNARQYFTGLGPSHTKAVISSALGRP